MILYSYQKLDIDSIIQLNQKQKIMNKIDKVKQNLIELTLDNKLKWIKKFYGYRTTYKEYELQIDNHARFYFYSESIDMGYRLFDSVELYNAIQDNQYELAKPFLDAILTDNDN